MIQYLCDNCKTKMSKADIDKHTFTMPRIVAYYATCNGNKLARLTTIKPIPTLLCDKCITLFANILPIDDEEE